MEYLGEVVLACSSTTSRPGRPMQLPPHLHRVQLFTHLVWHRDRSGKRMSPRLAWRVAGIASGYIEAIPDSVLEWWWKLQDLRTGEHDDDKRPDATHRSHSE